MFRPMSHRHGQRPPFPTEAADRWNPEDWTRAGVEPRVEDLLEDPITRLVMRRDRIGSRDVMAVVKAARHRLGASMVEDPPTAAVHRISGPVPLGCRHALMSPCP